MVNGEFHTIVNLLPGDSGTWGYQVSGEAEWWETSACDHATLYTGQSYSFLYDYETPYKFIYENARVL